MAHYLDLFAILHHPCIAHQIEITHLFTRDAHVAH